VIKDCQGATGERRHHKVARSAGLANPNREGAGDLPIPASIRGAQEYLPNPARMLWQTINYGKDSIWV